MEDCPLPGPFQRHQQRIPVHVLSNQQQKHPLDFHERILHGRLIPRVPNNRNESLPGPATMELGEGGTAAKGKLPGHVGGVGGATPAGAVPSTGQHCTLQPESKTLVWPSLESGTCVGRHCPLHQHPGRGTGKLSNLPKPSSQRQLGHDVVQL